MIKHGVLWSRDIWSCYDFIEFIMYSEKGLNQGSGVVGSRVLDVSIFHGCTSIMEQMGDHHGFCELENSRFDIGFNKESGTIGRGHKEVEANPKSLATGPGEG